MSSRWRVWCLTVALGVSCASAAPAFGAVRYAAAGSGDTSGGCATVANACRIDHAVNDASASDEVIVEAGSYTSTPSLLVPANVSVHGDDAEAVPVVSGTHLGGALLTPFSGSSVRRLVLNEMASTGLAVFGNPSNNVTLDDLQITGGGGAVAVTGTGSKLLDSVALSPNGPAVDISANGSDELRNVTAISPNGPAVWAEDRSGNEILNLKNVIARGASGSDLTTSIGGTGTGSTINVDHSNFKTLNTGGGGSVVQGASNQTAADPLFVNAGASDYREAAGSPTIDHGTTDALNGPSDPNGLPRNLGSAPDIGAFEFAPPPTVTTGAASTVATTSATLSATINPNGTATTDGFDIGTMPGVYTLPVSAPAAGSGTTAAIVAANVTTLSPNTTYYYRARATNSGGPTLGTEGSFTTPATPVSPASPPPCPPVSSLSRSSARPRAGASIGPGFDLFATDPQGTSVDFSQTPLPAGFFAPGSEPFNGTISLGGMPIDSFMGHTNLGDTDTIVQRMGPLTLGPPFPLTITVPIQLVQLHLQSVEPIQVRTGTTVERWDVQVGLSAKCGSTGTLTATQTDGQGGTFSSQLNVIPKLTFIPLSPGNQARTLDVADFPQLQQQMALSSSNVPWVPKCVFPVLVVPGLNDGGFCPGLNRFKDKIANIEQARLARHTVRPAEPGLEHFKCYAIRSQTPFSQRQLSLRDQFGASRTRVLRPIELCAPVRKNSERLVNRDAHLKCYAIREPGFRQRLVAVRNQFGAGRLTVTSPRSLCLSSFKTSVAQRRPPLAILSPLARQRLTDPYKCYSVAGASAGQRVTLTDQFGRERVSVLEPVSLCAPVQSFGVAVLHPVQHLVCYRIKDLAGRFRPRRVRMFNRLGAEVVRVIAPRTLCVPSVKLLLR